MKEHESHTTREGSGRAAQPENQDGSERMPEGVADGAEMAPVVRSGRMRLHSFWSRATANPARIWGLAAGTMALAPMLFAFHFSLPPLCGSRPPESALGTRGDIAPAKPARPSVLAPPARKVIVRQGDIPSQLLVMAGLGAGEVSQLIARCKPTVDLARLRPGETFTFHGESCAPPRAIDYRRGPLEIYRLLHRPTGWSAERVPVPVETRGTVVTGVIESSLFQAMEQAGEDETLAQAMADILAWQIDFAHECQSGDRFRLLVEKRYVENRFVDYGPVLAAEYISADRAVRAFSMPDGSGHYEYYDPSGLALRRAFLRMPLQFNRISSGFTGHRRNPITGTSEAHPAIDFAAPSGTPVWSVAEGMVRVAGYGAGNGRWICISHPGGYQSTYLHLSAFGSGIRAGARVHQKQVIGFVGSTGLSTGPHLDYRLTKNGSAINPLREKFPEGLPITRARLGAFQQRVAALQNAWEKPAAILALR